MKRPRYNYLLLGSLLVVTLVTLSTVLGPEIAASAKSSLNGSGSLAYLPMVATPGDRASPKIAGVRLEIVSPHLPGEMVSSEPDDASQLATAFALDPFQEFSIIAAPYGASPPIEDLPDSEPGGAEIYRAALSVYRTQQGGTPLPAPAVSLFGQTITGSYSIIDLITTAEIKQPIMIAEWVVEAESRLWIVRITRDLSDGTDPTAFLKSHQTTVVKVDTAAVNQPSARVEQPTADSSDIDASFQSPTTLPVPSWWSGECNVGNHAGSYPLNTFEGMVACGPLKTGRLVYFFPGAVGQYEWQCTEMAKRYLYLKHDIRPYQANGKDVVNNMPQQYIGTLFERISNGTTNKSPATGDVISFGPTTTFGHVAVVTAANVDTKGNGSIEIIEQNWSQGGRRNIPIKNWRVGGDMTVSNWLHLAGREKPGEWVQVSAGEFQMGCVQNDSRYSCTSPDLPLHTVYLDTYQIHKYEVTNEQYALFLNERNNNVCDGHGCAVLGNPYSRISLQDGQYVVQAGYENHPVSAVNWNGSKSYCTENGARLPSEAEWEKAARGSSDTRMYPWGNQPADCTRANFWSNIICVGGTAPVGSYPSGASPYGALDMAGNVAEWVNDWYDPDYYNVSPYANPSGPASSTYFETKVVRGGSWNSFPVWDNLSVAHRERWLNTSRWSDIGFRCASSTGG